MRRAGLMAGVLVCLASACNGDAGVRSLSAEPAPSNAPPSSASGTDEPVAPGGSAGVGDELFPELGYAGIDVQHYDVQLSYDPAFDAIEGVVGIDVVTTAPLDWIAFDSVGLVVRGVTVDGEPVTTELADEELWIDVPGVAEAGESFRVEVDYAGTPNADGSAAGLSTGWFHTAGGSYVLNEPDGARSWMPCNDHPSDKATYTFTITVPAGLTAVANGGLVDHRREDRSEVWVWQEDDPMATYLVQLMTGDYEIIEGIGPAGLPLVSVALRDDVAGVQPYVDLIPEQIEFFNEVFGPYPLDRYGIAVTDSFGGLAMETQGRSLFSREDLSGYLGQMEHLLLSHELAHQWFGDAVSPATWSDIWLNESFATYGQWLWFEHAGFATVDASANMALMGRYPGGNATGDPTAGELFGYNSYDGGAVVLHALRRTIGDDDFFTLLQRWVADNNGTSRTSADFIDLAEEVSGRDLGGFFDTWLYAGETPTDYP